jgi:hypothetical protein
MTALFCWAVDESRDGAGQLVHRSYREGDIARGATGNEGAAGGCADERECRSLEMRAAFAAAGNMNIEVWAQSGCGDFRYARGQRAGWDMRRRADRRAGTGEDMTAWIVSVHDKTKTFRRRRQRGDRMLREPDDQNGASGRGAHTGRALRRRHLHQFIQGRGVRMAKGEAKAAGDHVAA